MSRTLFLTAPPVAEPVTLEEALVQCHADAGIEDAWFSARIAGGRRKVEDFTRRSLLAQTWALCYDGGAPGVIELPRSPVIKVIKMEVDGVAADIDAVTIRTDAIPARVILPGAAAGGSLRIEYIAGYGDDGAAVPGPLKDAILLYVAYCYGNREGETDVPRAFYDLIKPYRLYL